MHQFLTVEMGDMNDRWFPAPEQLARALGEYLSRPEARVLATEDLSARPPC